MHPLFTESGLGKETGPFQQRNCAFGGQNIIFTQKPVLEATRAILHCMQNDNSFFNGHSVFVNLILLGVLLPVDSNVTFESDHFVFANLKTFLVIYSPNERDSVVENMDASIIDTCTCCQVIRYLTLHAARINTYNFHCS